MTHRTHRIGVVGEYPTEQQGISNNQVNGNDGRRAKEYPTEQQGMSNFQVNGNGNGERPDCAT
jgi:hypothetical protein